MKVCVAGMHRSGTSMVARLLNLCGVDLGPENELVPPGPDNPEGFWENVNFVVIDNLILEVLGGTWEAPPVCAAGWESRPALEPLRLAATELLERFTDREPWGWKDPRSSLVLPFWRRLVPELKVVLCLRHPLEVARSLARRDRTPLATGLDLWATYYRCVVRDVPPAARLITDYASYFVAPERETRRVLDWLGLPAGADAVAGACRSIVPHHRHHDASLAESEDAGLSVAVRELYAALQREAAGARPA